MTDDPVTGDHDGDADADGQPAAQERAEAGTARSSDRRAGRRLLLAAVLVGVVLIGVRAAGVGQDSGGDGGERAARDRTSTTATDPGGPDDAITATTTPLPTVTAVSPTSSVAPPDVARPRPPVDLTRRPNPNDLVEVARWWVGTFVSYGAAEPAADTVARLRPFTTPALEQALLNVPPAASYDPPVQVAGVSALVDPGGGPNTTVAGMARSVVTAETPDAVVVYEVVTRLGAGGWQVDETRRRV
jgi:hypothetical protein